MTARDHRTRRSAPAGANADSSPTSQLDRGGGPARSGSDQTSLSDACQFAGQLAAFAAADPPDVQCSADEDKANKAQARAIAQNLEQRDRVRQLVRSAATLDLPESVPADSPDLLLKNAGQMVEAGRLPLYVLTETHDATDRAAEQNARGKVALFDQRMELSTSGPPHYPLDPAEQSTSVLFMPRTQLGLASAGRVGVTRPEAQSDKKIKNTIVHEALHVVDNWEQDVEESDAETGPEERWPAKKVDQYIEMYRSELRAYWLSGIPGLIRADRLPSEDKDAKNKSKVTGTRRGEAKTVSTAFGNRRQEEIFLHMLAVPNVYPYLAPYYAHFPAFKAAVDAFDHPVGRNLVNSPRLDVLNDTIAAADPTMSIDAPEIQRVLDATRQLDANDRAFLADPDCSIWVDARAALPIEVQRELKSATQ
jgi:hypothetical protein